MQIIGYIITLLVGITLGLMGSGGSILTVPNLVYIMNIDPIDATTYSLLIVGITALVGSVKNIQEKKINYKVILFFGIPSMLTMALIRKFLVPLIPEIFTLPIFGAVKDDEFLMTLFAILMLFAAVMMIRSKQTNVTLSVQISIKSALFLIVQGVIIGSLSGLLGAGGGFLMIPGFVILAKLPMKEAVASSLFLVALNSIIGFISDHESWHELNWFMLINMMILSIVGIFIGNQLLKKISAGNLKKIFGFFILIISILVLLADD